MKRKPSNPTARESVYAKRKRQLTFELRRRAKQVPRRADRTLKP